MHFRLLISRTVRWICVGLSHDACGDLWYISSHRKLIYKGSTHFPYQIWSGKWNCWVPKLLAAKTNLFSIWHHSLGQWFSKWGPRTPGGPQGSFMGFVRPNLLSYGHQDILCHFHCHSFKWTVEFSRGYTSRVQQAECQSRFENLSSRKPDSREICEKCHIMPLFSQFLFWRNCFSLKRLYLY